VRYIARDKPSAAVRFSRRMGDTIRMLASAPMLGEACDHIRHGLRRFSHGNYAIYYEVGSEYVRFVRILHGARDAEAIFAEENE
jgi:plasmid stabilization system protein ParE